MNVIKQLHARHMIHLSPVCRVASALALVLASARASAQTGVVVPAPSVAQGAQAAGQPGSPTVPPPAGVQAAPAAAPGTSGEQPGSASESDSGAASGEAAPPAPPETGGEAPASAVSAVEAGVAPVADAHPASPCGSCEDEVAAAAAAAVEAELAAREAEEEVKTGALALQAYGFADFTYARQLTHNERNIIIPRLPSFYIGNFNLYLGADLGSRWRSLSEVRFTYLPDGAALIDETGMQRVTSSYGDYADYGRARKVGGVILERVWLEYSAHPLFNIRGGQWLTPYGIWNVDHGSPVVIGVTRPFIVGNELFPSHQTGLELYGSHGIDSTTVGYHLTLSNGRGPVDTYTDLDRNKAIGWRLWVRQDTPVGVFSVGTSGYRGQYTDTGSAMEMSPDMTDWVFTYPVVERYEELSLAGDFKWSWGGYLLQGEVIVHDVAYDDYHRAVGQLGTTGWNPDSRTWGAYGITGYRLPWLGVMPFVGFQYMDFGEGNPFTCSELNGGLNVRPTDRVVLKAVGLWLWRPDPWVFSKSEGQFMAQAAWSF